MENSKYLVRPSDFHIFEVDSSNSCYRSFSSKAIRGDGSRVEAQSHFTFDNLVNNYDFIEIEESEIEHYQEKNNFHMGFVMWQCRSDGHGGSKGGELPEYLLYIYRVNRYNKMKEDGTI